MYSTRVGLFESYMVNFIPVLKYSTLKWSDKVYHL
jgi:hypothetical protein